MLVCATAAVVVVPGGALSSAALAAPPAAGPSAQQVRQTLSRAQRRVADTESHARSRRYAYYTVGDVWKYTGPSGWAAGYVPGELWSCYQLTGRTWWRDRAVARQAPIGSAGITVESLNLGGLFFPSFARGYTLTGDGRCGPRRCGRRRPWRGGTTRRSGRCCPDPATSSTSSSTA